MSKIGKKASVFRAIGNGSNISGSKNLASFASLISFRESTNSPIAFFGKFPTHLVRLQRQKQFCSVQNISRSNEISPGFSEKIFPRKNSKNRTNGKIRIDNRTSIKRIERNRIWIFLQSNEFPLRLLVLHWRISPRGNSNEDDCRKFGRIRHPAPTADLPIRW